MLGPPVSALFAGCIVGLILSLVGGGGSILATPLLVYAVGIRSPHVALGTSACAVGLSAVLNLLIQARQGCVNWPCGLLFSSTGAAGALLGSSLGKAYDGRQLLFAFGLLMCGVGVMSALRRLGASSSTGFTGLPARGRGRLAAYGLCIGGMSGFFGVGGGILSTPAIASATGLPLEMSVGSSLLAIAVFGLVTAGNYALSGEVDWRIAAIFVVGGAIGGWLGLQASGSLGRWRGMLRYLLAGTLVVLGLQLAARSL